MNFLSACALSRRRRSKSARYCLPDSSLLLSYNPETSSRVTLASLGTVFQTGLSVLLRLRLLTVLFRLRLLRHVQNLSRITLMRHICSFTDFFLSDLYAPVGRWDLHGFTLVCGLSADFSCYRQSSAVQAQIQSEGNPRPSKSKNKKKSVKKIKSVASELSVSYFERVRTEPRRRSNLLIHKENI